jgi:glycosyltransferase involved in cell wall biosynthesis
MRIAEVVVTFPPECTGIGNVCYNNTLELTRLGNEVTVFTTQSSITKNPDSDFQVNRLKPVFRFGNAPILPQLLEIKHFDIVHLHVPFFFGSEITFFTQKLRSIPLVVTYHHDPILKAPFNVISLAYRYTLSRLFTQAKGVFVTSLDYGNNCNVRKSLNKARLLRELPLGVDISRFNPAIDPLSIRKTFNINQDDTVILFVGGLDRPHYFKGLQYLIAAFAQLSTKERCYLVVVGDGELKPDFIRFAQNLGVIDNTIFAGRVSDKELPPFYAASNFLVLPSFTMSEAFGLVLLEAMACGKAVIASDIPGVRSVVSPWKNGFLVDPANVEDLSKKMTRLIEDPQLSRKLGTFGRQRVEAKYNWKYIGLELNDTLKEIVC